jgi:hypothetical protein
VVVVCDVNGLEVTLDDVVVENVLDMDVPLTGFALSAKLPPGRSAIENVE